MEEYYDQNPISQLGLITIHNKRAEKVSEMSGRFHMFPRYCCTQHSIVIFIIKIYWYLIKLNLANWLGDWVGDFFISTISRDLQRS